MSDLKTIGNLERQPWTEHIKGTHDGIADIAGKPSIAGLTTLGPIYSVKIENNCLIATVTHSIGNEVDGPASVYTITIDLDEILIEISNDDLIAEVERRCKR